MARTSRTPGIATIAELAARIKEVRSAAAQRGGASDPLTIRAHTPQAGFIAQAGAAEEHRDHLGQLAEAGVAYLVTALAFPTVARRLPRSPAAEAFLRVRYPDGRGVLRRLLKTVTDQGFTVGALNTRSLDSTVAEEAGKQGRRGMVEVVLIAQARYPVSELAASLSEIEEVDAVLVGDNGEAA